MKKIDLRSDTVTQPTEKMRKLMAEAIVGDDVYEDDPTLKKLEKLAAEKVNKEAALFVPSGTFGNLTAVMTHCSPGKEILLMENSHIMINEAGGAGFIAGVQTRTIPMKTINTIDPKEIESRIREKNIHYPETGLICLENALGNGMIMPIENMEEIRNIAKENNLPIHLDGARVFNAAISLNIPVTEITDKVDSVMFCLSKGLCAPVGSILAGTEEFINKARSIRKMLGGGLRQGGILGAAGIVALEEMVDRLKDDHDNAIWLGEQLSKINNIEVKKDQIKINMVYFKITNNISSDEFVEKLKLENIIIGGARDGGYFRFVTNNDISREDLERVIKTIKNIVE